MFRGDVMFTQWSVQPFPPPPAERPSQRAQIVYTAKGSLAQYVPHGELQEETEDGFEQQSVIALELCLKTPIKCNMSRIKDFHCKITVSTQHFTNTFLIEEPRITPIMKHKPEMAGVCGFKRKMNHF